METASIINKLSELFTVYPRGKDLPGWVIECQGKRFPIHDDDGVLRLKIARGPEHDFNLNYNLRGAIRALRQRACPLTGSPVYERKAQRAVQVGIERYRLRRLLEPTYDRLLWCVGDELQTAGVLRFERHALNELLRGVRGERESGNSATPAFNLAGYSALEEQRVNGHTECWLERTVV